MFIVLLTYKVPIEEVNKYLSAHREFLDYYYKQGLLIASGPLKPRTGGIIIVTSNDRAQVEEIFTQDPFALAEIADYQFYKFTPIKHCESIKEMILKMEGNPC